jgi:hypothetical protein
MILLADFNVISIITPIASLLTFFIGYTLNIKSARNSRKPVLVFEYQQSNGWLIRNVGNGPALNIIVTCKGKKGAWKYFVRLPALAKDDKFILTWLGHCDVWSLSSVYTDFLGIAYTLVSIHDENHIRTGQKINPPKGFKVPRYWQPPNVRCGEVE